MKGPKRPEAGPVNCCSKQFRRKPEQPDSSFCASSWRASSTVLYPNVHVRKCIDVTFLSHGSQKRSNHSLFVTCGLGAVCTRMIENLCGSCQVVALEGSTTEALEQGPGRRLRPAKSGTRVASTTDSMAGHIGSPVCCNSMQLPLECQQTKPHSSQQNSVNVQRP